MYVQGGTPIGFISLLSPLVNSTNYIINNSTNSSTEEQPFAAQYTGWEFKSVNLVCS